MSAMVKHFWPVIDNDLPAKQLGRCFYCGEKLGAEHLPRCAIRRRTVVVQIDRALEVIVWMPEEWSITDIMEHYRGPGVAFLWSSLESLNGMQGRAVTGVREATFDDEESLPECPD